MLEALKKIQANPITHQGICANLVYQLSGADLTPRFRRWPLFSGSNTFPVPHPDLDPHSAFRDASFNDSLWADTPYGNNRRNLLQYLIDELTILDALEKIPSNYSSPYGICFWLSNNRNCTHKQVTLFLDLAYRHWPKHSGSTPYPIPGGAQVYWDNYPLTNRWDPLTEEGQHRWELVTFMKELLK